MCVMCANRRRRRGGEERMWARLTVQFPADLSRPTFDAERTSLLLPHPSCLRRPPSTPSGHFKDVSRFFLFFWPRPGRKEGRQRMKSGEEVPKAISVANLWPKISHPRPSRHLFRLPSLSRAQLHEEVQLAAVSGQRRRPDDEL